MATAFQSIRDIVNSQPAAAAILQRFDIDVQLLTVLLKQGPHVLDGRLENRTQVDRNALEFDRVARDPAQVEQLVHQPHQVVDLPVHHLCGLLE